MQISIWCRETQMASEYGRDWSYKPASFGVEMDIQYIATSHSSPMRQFRQKHHLILLSSPAYLVHLPLSTIQGSQELISKARFREVKCPRILEIDTKAILLSENCW